ncbi:murein L,D-transpeptidase catalytic domain family protein [Pedobacter frigoris]|uniref:murein L,D-transpeptidase catalytic domain family protein n=1 Tax=Pedobacter frigoris TaxID=2571272 RepID=UPI00292F8D2E|nr:murein L,D-transpeptidase catalytic domain family protein [Pedobacter frigoris]
MTKCFIGGVGFIAINFALTIVSWTSTAPNNTTLSELPEDSLYTNHITDLYKSAHLEESGLNPSVFEKAVTGFYNLKKNGDVSSDKSILTIADFDLNSTKKRLWIIDLNKKKVLLNTWVAHGQRSGSDIARHFSNSNNSFQSSIGFYLTGEVYYGQHGRSLRLDGMDEGYNSNARKRSIVVHGADYVSQETINSLGRLGRSQGCPAVAPEVANIVINTIEGKNVLFINVSDQPYTSRYLDEHLAAMYTAASFNHTDTIDSNQVDSLLTI